MTLCSPPGRLLRCSAVSPLLCVAVAVEALGSGLEDDGTVLLSLGTYIAAMTIGSSSRSADANALAFQPVRLMFGKA